MRGTDGTTASTAVALDELRRTLAADSEAERLHAVYALAARGEEAVPALRKNINDEDRYARANVAVALERIGA